MPTRVKGAVCGLAACLWTFGAVALAQDDAPTVVRGAPAAKTGAPRKHAGAHKAWHATASNGAPMATTSGAGSAAGTPEPPTTKTVVDPADPISLGMKWNGNSDNAQQTRVQNYDGSATGSGAEVGLKLHF